MPDRATPASPYRLLLVALVVALVLVAVGVLARSRTERGLAREAADAAVPSVTVVRPKRGPGKDGDAGVVLPGTVQALDSAAIYARTNGYVRRWLVDIGDRVRAGQTLAILDAPDVTQELAQAEANYQSALADARLARTTAARWQTLLAKDAVSQQEADERQGQSAARAAVAAAQLANVRRLRATLGFTRLTAPFAGTVTSRSAQVGALVVSGNAAAQPLFTISATGRVRVYVRVPQSLSGGMHDGLAATMTLPEYPGRTFPVTITRSAGAVDGQSGTVLVELQADNADRALKPGAYAQVRFPAAAAEGGLRLPSSTLVARDAGVVVAVVGGDDRVHLRRITIARDEGQEVVVGAGLAGGERVVDTPPDALVDGDRVRVEAARAAP